MSANGKIIHLIGQMERGGAERQLLYLAKELKDRGWDQVVVTLDPGQPWDALVTAMGMSLVGIQRRSSRLLRLLQLSYLVQQERPALVHSWSNHTNVYARWLMAGVPAKVFSFRNNPTVDSLGRSTHRVPNANIYRAADCVISNSAAVLESAKAAGVNPSRTEVIRNIVIVRGRAKPWEDVAVPRVVAAGALVAIKGYDIMIEAFGKLASEGRAFELLVAGDGPERSRLKQLATTVGLGSRFKMLGPVDDVPALFATAHLAVHASRSESLSNAILEAMAEGLPVVATDVGGTGEILADRQNGLLVPPNEPSLLAAQVKELLESPSLREKYGAAALRVVNDRFDAGRIATQYESVYRSILHSTAYVEEPAVVS
jgi:glycosyltransferase involved in cell wall biosynthesis